MELKPIQNFFKNRTRPKKGDAKAPATDSPADSRQTTLTFGTPSVGKVTPRSLFKARNHDEINEAANEKRVRDGLDTKSNLVLYQKYRKSKFEEISDEEKNNLKDEADALNEKNALENDRDADDDTITE